jgi:hypothetical protein
MGSTLNMGKIARALSDRAKLFDGAVAKVGIPAGKTYPDGTSIAYVAAIQEFGATVPAHAVEAKNAKALSIPTENGVVFRKRVNVPEIVIPPRPFMRNTREAKQAEWGRELADGAKAVVERRVGLVQMLDAVGHAAAVDVVRTIAERVSPPLKPSTMRNRVMRAQQANRGFGKKSMPATLSTPLNDTGALVAHISSGTGPSGAEFDNGKPAEG